MAARVRRSADTVTHRYFHKLYALDTTLDVRDATKSQIERAMQGHVLANAELSPIWTLDQRIQARPHQSRW
jgi:phosphatidylethanolamine-binding protein (PEBP) family uncharacterized protein